MPDTRDAYEFRLPDGQVHVSGKGKTPRQIVAAYPDARITARIEHNERGTVAHRHRYKGRTGNPDAREAAAAADAPTQGVEAPVAPEQPVQTADGEPEGMVVLTADGEPPADAPAGAAATRPTRAKKD